MYTAWFKTRFHLEPTATFRKMQINRLQDQKNFGIDCIFETYVFHVMTLSGGFTISDGSRLQNLKKLIFKHVHLVRKRWVTAVQHRDWQTNTNLTNSFSHDHMQLSVHETRLTVRL